MPGNATQYYDMAIEIPETEYNEIISATIDKILSLFISELNKIPGVKLNPNNVFTLNVSFKKPANISLPAKAENPVDITMNVGQGNLVKIRTVVGADVLEDKGFAMERLNFSDKLYYCDVSVGPIQDSLHLIENYLKNTVKQIPLLPLPMDKSNKSAFSLTEMDLKVIDDKSPGGLDAAATLLTFGGGIPGNKNNLTKSIISPSHPDKAVIAIYFAWFCRILQPLIAEALKIPSNSFDNCALAGPVDLSISGEDVTLKEFTIAPANKAISIHVAIEKSGFCYTANATMDASIILMIMNGALTADYHVDNVNIDTHVPWYCYILGAILGIFTGGVLGGFIGAILGAILGPLAVWLSQELLDNTIGKIADSISEKINSISPKINYPIVGLNIFLNDVFIDDISMISTITPIDTSPVRAEGEITVQTGDSIDLDTGKVGGRELLSADLEVQGVGHNVDIKALCNTAIARTNYSSFMEITRYKLYRFPYVTADTIPYLEMVHLDPVTNNYTTPKLFGIFTNDERFSAISIEALQGGERLRIKYRTYAKLTEPALEIIGGFRCSKTIDDGTLLPVLSKIPRGAIMSYVEESSPSSQKMGRWQVRFQQKNNPRGKFEAISNGLNPPLEYSWYIETNKLMPPSGSTTTKGVKIMYEIYDSIIVLEVPNNLNSDFQFIIMASVKDTSGMVISTKGCVHYIPQCEVTQGIIPHFPKFQQKYLEVFGLPETVGMELKKLS